MLSLLSGTLLRSFTDAALPFLDALVTWGAVVATYMVAKKLLENWIYWLVIDSISILLFISRDLWLTACLFGIYIVIIIFGFRLWSKALKENNAAQYLRELSLYLESVFVEQLSSSSITKIYLGIFNIIMQSLDLIFRQLQD